MKRRRHLRAQNCQFLLAALLTFAATPLSAQKTLETDEAGPRVAIDSWLRLGPVEQRLPAWHDAEKGSYEASAWIEDPPLAIAKLRPKAGESLRLADGRDARWEMVDGPLVFDGKESSDTGSSNAAGARLALAATWIEVNSFEKAKLHLKTRYLVRAWLDGDSVAERKTALPDDTKRTDTPELSGDLVLRTGKHLLVVLLVRPAKTQGDWSLTAEVERPAQADGTLQSSTLAERPLQLDDLLDAPVISGLDISPDGSLVALRIRSPDVTADKRDDWFEIRRYHDGALVRAYRGDSIYSGFEWAPTGRRFSYVTRDGKQSTLWVADLDDGAVETIVEAVEELSQHTWMPDGRSIVYSVRSPHEKDGNQKAGVQRMRDLTDRWSTGRDRSHLWQVSVRDGVRRRLTAGPQTTSLEDIHPGGERLLFSTTEYHYESRPFSRKTLHELDLQTLTVRKVLEGGWVNGAIYSPDGARLLVLASPNAFGPSGAKVPKGKIANDYDTQAYIVESESGDVTPISKDFDPKIVGAAWSASDGAIYLRCEERSWVHIYRFEPEPETYTRLETSVDVVRSVSLARNAPRMVYSGISAAQPGTAWCLDLDARTPTSRTLAAPVSEPFADVVLGKVEDWSFRASSGTDITGRVYYPARFDSSKRYPMIVYYYGGTSPTPRTFSGRYPKNLWAAHGYVVYVLQPSGATGFGQEFSSRHVNNWGRTVTREIDEGVGKFLAAHRFVDPKRVGCIGASYGGFMTMLLITQSQRFSAAISHAGISSLSSYWGEGWWGYLYSGVATADSFPWNRRDLYVEQSALFHADKIDTPLLLLHGRADTNVPPGESEQMYTALRVLGKDVEYVRFEGEDHWILSYEKRRIWAQTILAWFDWKLKEEPGYWEHLYPEGDE